MLAQPLVGIPFVLNSVSGDSLLPVILVFAAGDVERDAGRGEQ